jgi:hypothetical protein
LDEGNLVHPPIYPPNIELQFRHRSYHTILDPVQHLQLVQTSTLAVIAIQNLKKKVRLLSLVFTRVYECVRNKGNSFVVITPFLRNVLLSPRDDRKY